MFYLAFWRQRSTATVVKARNRQQARSRAMARQKQGYGELVSLQQARPEDEALIRRGVWVGRRRWSDARQPSHLRAVVWLLVQLPPNPWTSLRGCRSDGCLTSRVCC